jgi:hypothetical protein
MARNSVLEQIIGQVITNPYSPDVRAPGLVVPRLENPRTALRRCCAAHGILMGAVPENRGGQVLYAAQVAIQRERKSPDSAAPPTPPPPKTPLFGTETSRETEHNQQHEQSCLCTNK